MLGCLNNYTKSGDYYWVEAHVTPVYKQGVPAEYLSVRYAPSRAQVNKADTFYRELTNLYPRIQAKVESKATIASGNNCWAS
jgi:hypothetical protein